MLDINLNLKENFNFNLNSHFMFYLVEFGTVGAIGTNYPTTGFGAAYTLAHEIGKLDMGIS